MLRLDQLNRAASLALLPLMALAILWATRVSQPAARVAMPREGTIVVADLRGESLVFVQPGAPALPRVLALDGPPHELVAAGGRIYATLGRGNALVEVEPRAPGILRTLALAGEPHGLAAVDDRLLVTLDAADALVTLDRVSLTETVRQPTGPTPHSVAAAGGEAYVTDSRADTVHLAGGAAAAPTGALPESVAIAGEHVVSADAEAGAVSVFRRGTLELVARITTGGRPVRVVPLDATRVAVALNAGAAVAVVDLARGGVVKVVPTLPMPDGICISPSGEFAAVVANAARGVEVFRLRDWKSAGVIPAGQGPGACLWLP